MTSDSHGRVQMTLKLVRFGLVKGEFCSNTLLLHFVPSGLLKILLDGLQAFVPSLHRTFLRVILIVHCGVALHGYIVGICATFSFALRCERLTDMLFVDLTSRTSHDLSRMAHEPSAVDTPSHTPPGRRE